MAGGANARSLCSGLGCRLLSVGRHNACHAQCSGLAHWEHKKEAEVPRVFIMRRWVGTDECVIIHMKALLWPKRSSRLSYLPAHYLTLGGEGSDGVQESMGYSFVWLQQGQQLLVKIGQWGIKMAAIEILLIPSLKNAEVRRDVHQNELLFKKQNILKIMSVKETGLRRSSEWTAIMKIFLWRIFLDFLVDGFLVKADLFLNSMASSFLMTRSFYFSKCAWQALKPEKRDWGGLLVHTACQWHSNWFVLAPPDPKWMRF